MIPGSLWVFLESVIPPLLINMQCRCRAEIICENAPDT